MFDQSNLSSSSPDTATPGPAAAGRPLEDLESEICTLAGHLAAATCRFLVLLAEFDARRGWASWDMPSCAAWLSWKCQLSSGTAREHVRVARALRELPVIRGEFAVGRFSYAKVRALTRIADPDSDADLAEMAGPMTANQLERFARAHRTVTANMDEQARLRRRLTWRLEDDGSLHDQHDAEITADTIVPPWCGERLDLDYAIAVLFGNQQARQARRDAALAA